MSETPEIVLEKATSPSPTPFRYEIIGYDEIAADVIRANPDNPRPTFMLSDTDESLMAMADSIRTTGQHRPALVYECVGHYKFADEPGTYVLLQGERRWRSTKIANVATLRCFLTNAPRSEEEERLWLSNEEAFKEAWGTFFELRAVRDLAAVKGVEIDHPELALLCGLSRDKLRTAAKMFSLEPEILALVAEYEEHKYRNKLSGRNTRGRLSKETGVNQMTVEKAAKVYDIFTLLRQHPTLSQHCKKWNDTELQIMLAAKNSTLEEYTNIVSILRSGEDLGSGQLTMIDQYLTEEKFTARQLLRGAGASNAAQFKRFITRVEKLDREARGLLNKTDQLGGDRESLLEFSRILMRCSTAIQGLDNLIDKLLQENK